MLWKVQTLQRCKLYNERRAMLKLGKDVEAADARPKRGKNQEPNAELKRERHLLLDVNQPSEREHLRDIFG